MHPSYILGNGFKLGNGATDAEKYSSLTHTQKLYFLSIVLFSQQQTGNSRLFQNTVVWVRH